MAKGKKKSESNSNVLAKNKKVFFDYEILERYEAGIALLGTEVKSIKEGKVSIKECYGKFIDTELFLIGMNISEFKNAGIFTHSINRERKLLLHKKELKKIRIKLEIVGNTLIPLRIYKKKHLVKVEIGICKGKREFEKRDAIKKRDVNREIDRAIKNFNKY